MSEPRRRRIYLSPPHLGTAERRLLLEALDSNWIAPLGPQVDAFEREFAAALDLGHAAATASGTAALHLALAIAGVGPGDEVLCSDLTFVASANAIAYLGARPVFVDSDAHTWCMDPGLLREELAEMAAAGHRPRAAVVVDLYGQSADYDRIGAACAEYGVTLIEDAAEALGASYRDRPVGGFGRMGVFSFNGNKIITTSGGGMLTSHEPAVVERARFLASQARDPALHYEHSTLGYNYRMSNLLAAVGRGQMQLLPQRVERRRAVFDAYAEGLGDLPGIDFMPEARYGRATRWLTCLTVEPERFGADRDQIIGVLEAHDIEARPVWKPMHLQPLYAACRRRGGEVSARLFGLGLCLPSGSSLSDADQRRVIDVVRSCYGGSGGRRGR